MLDSLDLKSLAEVIERNRRVARYRWLSLLALLVGLTLIMLILFITPSPQENRNCNCVAATAILTALPVIGYFGAIAIFILNRQSRRKNIKQYTAELAKLNQPSFPIQWLSLSSFVIIGWVLFWIFSVAFLNLNPIVAIFIIIIPGVVLMFPIYWTSLPMRRGQYNEMFRRWVLVQKLPYLHDLRPTPFYGAAHMFSGNQTESERVQLQLLAQSLSFQMSEGVALNNYACELVYQGRYEEAQPLLEMAIKIQPEIPSSYESLASWYLYQSQNPERASELCKFALDLSLPFYYAAQKKILRAVGMATYAWSEARLGHVEKAHELLNKAFKSTDSRMVPYFALINYTAGETELALNDIPAARKYFERAAQIDPQGRFGRMAREALSRIV